MRQREILGLQKGALQPDKGTLEFRQALQRVGKSLTMVQTKTDKSRRTIQLPIIAIGALREHLQHQLEERRRAGSLWEETGYVFANEVGRPLDGTSVTHQFQRLLEKAGLPTVRFHSLRHSAATLMVSQGVPLKTVSAILGHKDVGITANIYTDVIDSLMKEAADEMDGLLAPAAKYGLAAPV